MAPAACGIRTPFVARKRQENLSTDQAPASGLAVVLAAVPFRHFSHVLRALLRTDVTAGLGTVSYTSSGQITAVEPCTRSASPLGSVGAEPFNRAPIATAEAVIRLQIMPFLGVCSALTTRSPPYG